MKAFQLRPYQSKAIEAIQAAIDRNQKHIVVEIVRGCGKSLILAKTVETLSKGRPESVLVLTDRSETKAQIKDALFKDYQDYVDIDRYSVIVETEQKILRQQHTRTYEPQFVVFYDAPVSESIYEALSCKEKTVIVFSSTPCENSRRLFTPSEVVFSYSYADAVNDGYLTPAMDVRAFEPAVEAFSKQLLQQFGYLQIDPHPNIQNQEWDLVVYKGTQKIWVECKTYKSQVVSPSTANSLLKTVLMRKMKQAIPQEDIVLLVVLSRIPSFQKNEIYDRYRIIVLDIENLVFYSKGNSMLLKQLSQLHIFLLTTLKAPLQEK